FRAPAIVLLLLLALTALPQPASAQGYPGGGMGGMGGLGGGRGRGGQSREAPGLRGPSGDDVAKQMEELGSLDKALHDVPHLDKHEKDSLKVIVETYGKIFRS